MDQMSEELIRDCSQLVKANSIEGVKKTSVTVIYTPWSNLKKEGSMDVGQVGFFNDKLVKKFVVLEKDKDVSTCKKDNSMDKGEYEEYRNDIYRGDVVKNTISFALGIYIHNNIRIIINIFSFFYIFKLYFFSL